MSEREIWDYLLEQIGNSYGVAGIMGNLMAESALNPRKVNGASPDPYIEKADSGDPAFISDKKAFGFAQWCHPSRKLELFNYAKGRNVSVADPEMQLSFMLYEMDKSYKSTLTTVMYAKSIKEASDAVMLKYEIPADRSEAAKAKRAEYGKMFYDSFAGDPLKKKRVYVKDDVNGNVNIRRGDSKQYPKIGTLYKGETGIEYVAASETGWYAVRTVKEIGWVDGTFTYTR